MQVVTRGMFERCLSPALFQQYISRQCAFFAQHSPSMKRCPNNHLILLKLAIPSRYSSLACKICGMELCSRCGEEPHLPCSCGEAKDWTRIPRVREWLEKDRETDLWILGHTRPCPACGVRIEKNQGCLHMTCGNCASQFCWNCGGDWRDHGTQTGGFFTCNRPAIEYRSEAAFTGQGKETERGEESKKAETAADFDYYLKGYYNHELRSAYCDDRIRQIDRDVMWKLEAVTGLRPTDLEFVRKAAAALAGYNRFLKYSYVYGYYQGVKRDTFAQMAETMERHCERLVWMLDEELGLLLAEDGVVGTDEFAGYRKRVNDEVAVSEQVSSQPDDLCCSCGTSSSGRLNLCECCYCVMSSRVFSRLQ